MAKPQAKPREPRIEEPTDLRPEESRRADESRRPTVVRDLREAQPKETPAEAFQPDTKEAPKPTSDKPTSDEPATDKAAPPKRKWLRRVLLLAGPLLAIALGLYFYLSGGRFASTDDAYLQADKVTISTDVSGIVAAIEVTENARVKAGQVLFRLDEEPFRIALAGAEAQLGIVRNQIATLKATYQQNLAQIQQARTDVELTQRTYQRQQDLASRGAASVAALDQARHDLDAANQRVVLGQRAADATLAQLGGDPNQAIESNANYKQALAQVDAAQRNLRHATVTAPMDGIVTNVPSLQVGEYLPAAQAAFNLVATDHVWVQAFLKETDLTYVKPNDTVDVTVDTYPDRDWHGTVASISPASGSEFAVLPAQNSSGNWVKVVQRIPVRVAVEVPENAPPLRSGMSANVDIDTGHERSLGGLADSIRRTLGL
jgi:membrane fusion protein (multidrug efflux system)